jgi:large subunit ribosomal protein L21
MYAVIQTGGKQYRVQPGEVLLVERLPVARGAHVFDQVLLVSDGADILRIGAPTVAGAVVAATVLGELQAKKVVIFKKKKRKGYRRKRGHRQIHARVRIDAITG